MAYILVANVLNSMDLTCRLVSHDQDVPKTLPRLVMKHLIDLDPYRNYSWLVDSWRFTSDVACGPLDIHLELHLEIHDNVRRGTNQRPLAES